MRTRISVLATAIAIATASFCFASEHHQANIEGFLSGEFAVKGTIEQQVNQRVVTPLLAEMSKAKGAQIAFVVVGSADHTGGGAQNDRLAKSRADEVSAFLLEKFPGAKFVTLTKGDERNAKMVTVTWSLVPIPAAKNGEIHGSTNSLSLAFYVGGGLMLLIGARLIVLRVRNHDREALQRPIENANVLMMPTPESKLNATETVEVDGMSISCLWENGMLLMPIPNKSGDGFLRKIDARAVRSSFRNFLNNPTNQSIVEDLIKQGKIQKKQEMTA